VRCDSTGTLTCEDGNDNVICNKQIYYTDFPAVGIIFYFFNNTILRPGEYWRS
jgi:uncharacterized protein DUF6876